MTGLDCKIAMYKGCIAVTVLWIMFNRDVVANKIASGEKLL